MALTDEQIKNIHKAMEECNGHTAGAAVLMGWPSKKLKRTIEGCDQLNTRWGKQSAGDIPNDTDTIHRKSEFVGDGEPVFIHPTGDLDITEQAAMVQKMKEENEQFASSLTRLGWDDSVVNIAKELHSMADNHFKSGLQLMHGGLVHTFLSNIKESEQLKPAFEMAVKELENKAEEAPVGSAQRAAILGEIERIHRIMAQNKETTVRVNEVIHKSALVQAVVKQADRKKKGRSNKT